MVRRSVSFQMSEVEIEVANYIRAQIEQCHPLVVGDPLRIIDDCRAAILRANNPQESHRRLSIDWSQPVDLTTWENLFLLKLCGVHFPIEEAWNISRQMLVLKEEHCTGRFWGRIVLTATERHYTIAEVESEKELFKYFCLAGSDGIWTALPDHTSETAQKKECEFALTGDLDYICDGISEADRLTAIITLISGSTCVDINRFGSDINALIPSLHCHPLISLSAFRRSRVPDGPRRTLDKDQKGSWSIQYVGDPNVYAHETNEEKDLSLGLVHISSNVWPGAHYLLSGYMDRSFNCFFGNGLERNELSLAHSLP